MTTPGYVQGPPDSTGKKVDTNELTRNSQTVERQNVSLADPVTPENIVAVNSNGTLSASMDDLCIAFRTALLQALNNCAFQNGSDSLRVDIQTFTGSLSTITTVSTVTSMSQVGGQNILDALVAPIELAAWGQNVRSLIT